MPIYNFEIISQPIAIEAKTEDEAWDYYIENYREYHATETVVNVSKKARIGQKIYSIVKK